VAGGTVPDADITWTIKEGAGRVAFAGGSTGPEVAVTATSTGAFRLEVDIKGLVITPPHVRPYFTGTVLPAVNVPVTVFIVQRTTTNYPARASSEIPGLLADANKILWQRGLTLVQSGPIRYLNNTEWLNHPDVNNNTNLTAMLNTTNSLGNALEFYFVDTLEGGATAGLCCYGGIVLSGDATGRVIAHEVLHACNDAVPGVEDIYPVRNDSDIGTDPVTGVACEDWLPMDWGGGYYPPGLTQRELINRLVMKSGGWAEAPSDAFDLPMGPVWGYHDMVSNGVPVRVLGLSACGQAACTKTPGSH